MINILRKIRIAPRLYFMFGFIVVALLFIAYSGVSSRIALIDQSNDVLDLVRNEITVSSGGETLPVFFEIQSIVSGKVNEMEQANRNIIIYIAVGLVFALFMSAVIVNSIVRPLKELSELSKDVAAGRFNANIDRQNIATDEIGRLAKDLFDVTDAVRGTVEELHNLDIEYNKLGHINFRVDTSKYQNSYRDMLDNVNAIMSKQSDVVHNILTMLNKISEGDFKTKISEYPGDMALITNTLRTFSASLQGISSEINKVIQEAINGDFSRSDSSTFKGDWKSILLSMDDLMEAIEAPVHEIENVLGFVSRGDFSKKIVGVYKGDFLKIESSVNSTISTISSYIHEIDNILSEISALNLHVRVNREYIGEFTAIKNSINSITETFSALVNEIQAASVQVETGAGQIATSTNSLMANFQEQTSSMSQATDAINVLTDKTRKNASDASQARDLSGKVQEAAGSGAGFMYELSNTMNEIKTASAEIANVAVIIEGIALQTNLLALNASVEAARAGEHGRGFHVVADEVRSLAGRSAAAAKEASDMIANSINRVEEGVQKTAETTEALESIVQITANVADVVANISLASDEQVSEISKIQGNMELIYNGTSANSGSVQSDAAVSQELSAQAAVLRGLVEKIRVK